MAGTDQQRFDEALKYLDRIDSRLTGDVRAKIGGRSLEAGKEISLAGQGYWRSGSGDQHVAVRALLLCQKAYLTPPYSTVSPRLDHDKTKKYYYSKPEAEVREAICCYVRTSGADLAAAARRVNGLTGNYDLYTLNRQSKDLGLGSSPTCYSAVWMWLFKAGFVSIKWLATTKGFNAYKVNEVLGDGRDNIPADQIPAGHIFNFHRPGHKETCHWGVSIGNGRAIATNTTALCGNLNVYFNSGDSRYGEFTLRTCYDVCEYNYALPAEKSDYKSKGIAIPDITTRDLDPGKVPSYC